MKKISIVGIVGLALALLPGGMRAQVVTVGGSVLGRPLAITGRTSVRFSELPPNVQQTIQSQVGGGTVAYVARGTYSGRGYAVTLVQNGGIQTLQFTENGSQISGYGGFIVSPVSDSRTIEFGQLPPAVQNSVLASGGAISSVSAGTYSATVYDALVQPPGAGSQHVIVTPSGGLLQGVTANAAATANQPAAVNEAAGANAPEAPVNSNAAEAAATPVGQPTGSLSFQDLSWSIQRPMLERSNYAHFDSVQQLTMPNGGVGYRGLYTRNNQPYQVTVAQDGTVVSEGLLSTSGVER